MGRPQTLKEAAPGLFRIIAYFSSYIGKHRRLMAGSMLALFAEVVFRLLEPWPLKFIFDYIIVPEPANGIPDIPAINILDTTTLLTFCVLAVVAFTGLRALSSYCSTVGFALIGNRVLTEVRDILFRHLQYLSLSFHTKARTGDLIVRFISDIGMLKDVAVTAVLPLFGNVLILLGMMAVMFWINWKLTLLSLAIVPLFWLRTTILSKRIQEVSRKQRKREGAMAATAAESIGAIKIVQALSLEETFARVFSGQNQKSLKEGVQAKRLAANLERTVDVLVAVATALVLWYGVRLVLRGELTPGDILVFLTYLKAAFKPVRDFAKYTGRLAKATASGERILDLLQRVPEIHDLPDAARAPTFGGTIRFENVSFAYEPDHRVLEGVDFEVHPGQQVALVGPSGNGKSTLVSLILRLYDPVEGRVMIDGRDIREYTLESLRSQISVVMQESLLFAASVRDNIAYGAPGASPEEIEDAARLANAHDFILALPEGYETILGERGATLSSGQRQRLAVARAAVRKSPILILDEPTTGLDEENEKAVIEALERLSRGRTVFLITHDLHHAARADLIFYLQGGRVQERGSHDELMDAKGLYAKLFKLQSMVGEHDTDEEKYAINY